MDFSASLYSDGCFSLTKSKYPDSHDRDDNFGVVQVLPSRKDALILKEILEKYLSKYSDNEIADINKKMRLERISNSKQPRRREKKSNNCNIYIIKNHRNGYTKIGFTTKNAKFREATLQSQEPEVELIGEWTGNILDEEILHNLFKDKRVRGEWFELSDKNIKEIHEYFSIK